MKSILTFIIGICLATGTAAWAQQGPKDDIKDAGKEAKKAGRATAKAAKKTGSATKKAAKKGVNKAASGVEKGAGKVKNKTDEK